MNALRRTALLAGFITAIAGGTAAIAAPGDTTPLKAPDPYLGAWALSIDGVPAGPVTTVDGCNVRGQVVEQTGPSGTGKTLAPTVPAGCSFEFGQGMSTDFYTWLNAELAGNGAPRKLELARTDNKGAAYAFELTGAHLSELTLPKLQRASTEAILLKATVAPEHTRRVKIAGAKTLPAPVAGFAPAELKATLGSAPLDVDTIGPWTARVQHGDGSTGQQRELVRVPGTASLGDLPLRVPELHAATELEPWLQSFVVEGKSSSTEERPLSISLGGAKDKGLEIAWPMTGLIEGDLAPRADGNRAYMLYTERVTLAPR